uniref:Uncharacterized protein n=1 Tax=Opuntia streptacantha TaxID=393608 RepID=A0A7C8YRT8_OPUST
MHARRKMSVKYRFSYCIKGMISPLHLPKDPLLKVVWPHKKSIIILSSNSSFEETKILFENAFGKTANLMYKLSEDLCYSVFTHSGLHKLQAVIQNYAYKDNLFNMPYLMSQLI